MCYSYRTIEREYATGPWDTKSPHCMIYKTLFPKLLCLKGLRLLKLYQEKRHVV